MEVTFDAPGASRMWTELEFRSKPGEPSRAPPWVAPHQPRLDWQMWFAALGEHRQNWWLWSMAARVLEASPPLLRLLDPGHGIDADRQPLAIRATLFDYHFTRSPREEAERLAGPVDIFCSNAGIARLGDETVATAEWQLNWDIHVMSHVFAARAVIPGMIERGGGYLVNTASAAGLLRRRPQPPAART